jgi:leucyl aminopeptidase
MFQSIRVGGTGRDTLVVGYFQGQAFDTTTAKVLKQVDPSGAAAAALKRPESTGEAGAIAEAFASAKGGQTTRVLVVGLDRPEALDTDAVRTLAGNIGRKLAAVKATGVQLALTPCFEKAGLDLADAGQAFGEGLGLLAWVCDEFKGTAAKKSSRVKLSIRAGESEFDGAMARGVDLAESANFTRTLSQTPPNVATTGFIADMARKLARKTGLSCKILEGEELVREKMIGLINVGKASENKPCLIRLEYKPRGSSGKKPAVLVGKTMTYDTGGLSLKINNGMVGMKRDKDGGCAVLGAMHAIATVIKPRRPVVALLAVAENSISDEAYRPDDVLRYRNGVTVEVTNTDAEGRLVLADALCWACDKEKPAYIIDLATLTGGVVVALGSTFAGMFCEHDGLRGKIEAAAKATGERVWRLPMHAEYRDLMKSPIADILNSNPNRKAHPIQGAAFLSYFVDEKIPWCHLDIAGVHATEKSAGCFVEGPTGWGARLLANLLENDTGR